MTNTYHLHNTFQRPFIRDLAFAIICPNALNDWIVPSYGKPIHLHHPDFWQNQFSQYHDRLIQLDSTKEYQKLTKFLMNRPSPHRLGFHFEGLILFWLIDGFNLGLHCFEMITHNVQIIENNITLGELDLIIKNHKTNDIEHWELTIKFFLGSPPFLAESWVGINSKDNLQRKINHMVEKPFTHTETSDNHGKKYSIDKRYAVIKGRFFQPYRHEICDGESIQHKTKLPAWINPEFPMHVWCNAEQSREFINQTTNHLSSKSANHIRKAHYIEWFTNRPFYRHNHHTPLSTERLHQLTTGLYFLNSTESKNTSQEIPFILKV